MPTADDLRVVAFWTGKFRHPLEARNTLLA